MKFSPPQKEARRVVSDLRSIGLPFLDALSASPSLADRRLWLRVAADCLVAWRRDDPRRQAVVAAASAILTGADEATRSAFARRLAASTETADALAMIESLGGESSLIVLGEAGLLPRERLVAAVKGSAAQARAVAGRADLDGELAARLAERDEIEVAIALAQNRRAPIDAERFAALARRAKARIAESGDRRLADALLERAPATVEQAALFLEASPIDRGRIIAAAQRATLGRRLPIADGGESLRIAARLERAAMAGDWAQFENELAEAFGCGPELAARIAADKSGEPLAVALAALHAPNDATVRVLAARDLVDGGQYRRIAALARLKEALTPAAARLALAALIGASAPVAARRRPQLDPTAAPTPSRPAPVRNAESTPAALRRRRAFAFVAATRRDAERA